MYSWFFANCVTAGLRLHDRAVFTDRGLQREAQQELAAIGVAVNLKFCSLHISFNVIDRFKSLGLDIDKVTAFIYCLQATTTMFEYESVIGAICQRFPIPIHPGTAKEELVSDYLCGIHPVSWTQFGNSLHNPVEGCFIETNWSSCRSYG